LCKAKGLVSLGLAKYYKLLLKAYKVVEDKFIAKV